MDAEQIEKYSSAFTLSDMEVFIFPDLMYSLLLANIMSPIIWKWRDEDCFKKIKKKPPYKKLMRLKQFIMDEYDFNLDLETWGLTKQDTELERFEKFISPQDIAQSNALFGYHGDKYYFDVDIRRHFGLDKFNTDVIPYWKTETVEAMNAFPLRDGYSKPAGECVSLSSLYAAAAFIVCGIPLEDIFMVLTPLHSQNFIDISDGVLTNNRRIVTKTMWFNGTAISDKAQRALRNEQVTIVAHNTGYAHCFYPNATIDKEAFQRFRKSLGQYLSADFSTLNFANFLRANTEYQRYFQFCCEQCRGGQKFAKAEVLFHYEHGSPYRIADDTYEKLIEEVSEEDILPYKLTDRLCTKQLTMFYEYEKIDIRTQASAEAIKNYIAPFVPDTEKFIKDLVNFLYIEPKLPSSEKNYIKTDPVNITVDWDRQQIIDYLSSIRSENITADLAFYAYRDMGVCDWLPFIKAAVKRNPVSLEMTRSMSIDHAYNWLEKMNNISIYDENRLAQPDEVANYKTGDGIEKAFLLANVIKNATPEQHIKIVVDNSKVILRAHRDFSFVSRKNLTKEVEI